LVQAGRAPVYGSGLNVRDWIHVNDHVDGIWLALEKGLIGSTYLFGARDTQSNLDVVVSIAKILGLTEKAIEFVEDRPGHDLKYALDPTTAEQELGWTPQHSSILDNLPAVVSWYNSE